MMKVTYKVTKMKEKCPFYKKICGNPNECVFQIWHYSKKECRKGGILKTPNKLKCMEENEIQNHNDLHITKKLF